MTVRGWIPLALAAAALALPPARAERRIPEARTSSAVVLGAQAWTVYQFTVSEGIEKTAAAGGKVIEFSPGQPLSKDEPGVKWDHNASPETIEKVKAQLARFGVRAVNYGVVGI